MWQSLAYLMSTHIIFMSKINCILVTIHIARHMFAMLFYDFLSYMYIKEDIWWIRRVKCLNKDKQDIEKLKYRQI